MSKVLLDHARLRQAREFLLAAETASKAGIAGSDEEDKEDLEMIEGGISTLDDALARQSESTIEFDGIVAGTLVASLLAGIRILPDMPFADSKGVPETIEAIEKASSSEAK